MYLQNLKAKKGETEKSSRNLYL